MENKFPIDELAIRIFPGGFLLAVIFLVFSESAYTDLDSNLDFLYTFLFFCAAFISGELLQTLAHEFEWLIDIFFKFRRPSGVFLYRQNPVIGNNQRDKLMNLLSTSGFELKTFNKKYSDLSILFKRNRNDNALSQSIFWELYSKVSGLEEMRIANRSYLFVRVMLVEFLLLGGLFLFSGKIHFGAFFLAISALFLWRGRGTAKGLVFKTVLLSLRDK